MWVNPGSAKSPLMITFVQSPSPGGHEDLIIAVNMIGCWSLSHVGDCDTRMNLAI